MIVGSWNIRGICSPQKQRAVTSWVNKHLFDIFGILETKTAAPGSANRCITALRNKGFNHLSDDLAGGRFLIFWKAHLKTTVLDVFDQGAFCHVDNGFHKFFVGFIYGRNNQISRNCSGKTAYLE